MKVFLSHSHRDAALVREIRGYLPKHIATWVDEDDLLIGSPLERSIRSAIQEESDFVVIFLGQEAVRSRWVKKELEWALARENQLRRTFVLPILLDQVWDQVEPKEFRDHVYLTCFEQTEAQVRGLAEKLSEHLFVWLSRHLDQQKSRELEAQRNEELGDAALNALMRAGTEDERYIDSYSKGFESKCQGLVAGLRGLPDQVKLERLKTRLDTVIEERRRTNPGIDTPPPATRPRDSQNHRPVVEGMASAFAAMALSKGNSFDRKYLTLLEELRQNIEALETCGTLADEILSYTRDFGTSNLDAWGR